MHSLKQIGFVDLLFLKFMSPPPLFSLSLSPPGSPFTFKCFPLKIFVISVIGNSIAETLMHLISTCSALVQVMILF